MRAGSRTKRSRGGRGLRRQLPAGPRQPALAQTLAWGLRPLPFAERCRARHGRTFTLRLLGFPPMVVLSHPDDVRDLFTAPADALHPGAGATVLEPVVGSNSLALLDEDAHLDQRRLLLPAFHGERIQRLTAAVEEIVERHVASWPRGEPVALHPRLQRLSLEVILRAILGIDAAGGRLEALRESVLESIKGIATLSNVMPPLRRTIAGRGPWARFQAAQARTDELVYALIADHRREAVDRDDALTTLLQARHEDGSPMSDVEIRDELVTLVAGGYEAIAMAMAWAFERLAREPQTLARLRDEIVRGDGDAFLTATIQETLRRRPVLPSLPRLVMRETPIGGRAYPPGVLLWADAYLLHHDPEIYPDPYAFRPQRFLDRSPGTYTWIPFGGGRRRCIGASFAMLEMKAVVRTVVAHGRLLPAAAAAERTRRHQVGLAPAHGARVVLGDRLAQATAAGREEMATP